MFEDKPSFDSFSYRYVLSENLPCHSFIEKHIVFPALRAVKGEYGVDVQELAYGNIPYLEEGRIPYILYGPINPSQILLEEKEYIRQLGRLANVKINVISAYSLENDYDAQEYLFKEANVVKKLTDDLNVNVIYPDTIYKDQNLRSVDFEDIRDNIICETVRVKYMPNRVKEDVFIDSKTKDIIGRMSALFKRYHLWHRDTTDGALLLKDSKNQIFISQAKTDKTQMEAQHFSLVRKFNVSDNTISFSGEKIPSSDSPELLSLYSLLQENFSLGVHFHCNEITRSNRFNTYKTKEKIEYGKFLSGKIIYDELIRINSNWLILLEHGILWVGNSCEEFEEFVVKTLRLNAKLIKRKKSSKV